MHGMHSSWEQHWPESLLEIEIAPRTSNVSELPLPFGENRISFIAEEEQVRSAVEKGNGDLARFTAFA